MKKSAFSPEADRAFLNHQSNVIYIDDDPMVVDVADIVLDELSVGVDLKEIESLTHAWVRYLVAETSTPSSNEIAVLVNFGGFLLSDGRLDEVS